MLRSSTSGTGPAVIKQMFHPFDPRVQVGWEWHGRLLATVCCCSTKELGFLPEGKESARRALQRCCVKSCVQRMSWLVFLGLILRFFCSDIWNVSLCSIYQTSIHRGQLEPIPAAIGRRPVHRRVFIKHVKALKITLSCLEYLVIVSIITDARNLGVIQLRRASSHIQTFCVVSASSSKLASCVWI